MTESQKPPKREVSPGLLRDLAVDKIEDAGGHHDHAGQDEAAISKRPTCRDADEYPDERENIRMNPERHALPR
jgi:hypothetical protein